MGGAHQRLFQAKYLKPLLLACMIARSNQLGWHQRSALLLGRHLPHGRRRQDGCADAGRLLLVSPTW